MLYKKEKKLKLSKQSLMVVWWRKQILDLHMFKLKKKMSKQYSFWTKQTHVNNFN